MVAFLLGGCATKRRDRPYDLPEGILPPQNILFVPSDVTTTPYASLPDNGEGTFVL